MKNVFFFSMLSFLFLLSSCQEESISKKEEGSANFQGEDHAMMMDMHPNFATHLKGEANNVVTDAQGQALFKVSKDGASIAYKLILANIENVTMAHIHLITNEETQSGPPVVWLYPAGPPPQLVPGRSDGVFAEGAFSSDQLVGPLAGLSLSDLIEAMHNGQTYVNVHTNQYPGGEIRGDI